MEDDKLLALVADILSEAPHSSIAEELQLDVAHGWHAHEVNDDEVCYVIAAPGKKTYYMCTSPPVDNDNLVCEKQADGMDWVCVAEYEGFWP